MLLFAWQQDSIHQSGFKAGPFQIILKVTIHLAFQVEENPLGGKQDLRTVGLVQPESAGAGLEISQALVSWPNAHQADQRQRPRGGLQAPTGPALQVPPSRIRPESCTG